MSANERQVGGTHYKSGGEEHWDRVHRLGLDYFQGQITKYVERWKLKNGVQDLEKAKHFLEKYIELVIAQKTREDIPVEEVVQQQEQAASMREDHDGPKYAKTYTADPIPKVDGGKIPEFVKQVDIAGYAWLCPGCNNVVFSSLPLHELKGAVIHCWDCRSDQYAPERPYATSHETLVAADAGEGTMEKFKAKLKKGTPKAPDFDQVANR